MALSKTQVDRLGERLRRSAVSEVDRRLLDDYRSSFDGAYRTVVAAIRKGIRKRPSGRPRKSTDSIIAKLNRETIRLSQIQDIAGCRLVVAGVRQQEQMLAKLIALFPEGDVIDRRRRPSHGYRAVHIVTYVGGKPIEIQLRTKLQDVWAQLSEAMSDVVDKDLKYGGGPEEERTTLDTMSKLVYVVESGRVRLGRRTVQTILQGLWGERPPGSKR